MTLMNCYSFFADLVKVYIITISKIILYRQRSHYQNPLPLGGDLAKPFYVFYEMRRGDLEK
ncbi:hypothetical protein ACSAZL_17090 [Methanosarcina sp. T3]|uniref:hypothetical protein n=1 Tax=Methanosarcina sp. T3 TaxID=3439062 RepID=UPI003F85A94A